MKVLITGANGFLGSWLTRKLIAEGHEVSILVRKNSDLSELQGLTPKILFGDVTDVESLQQAFRNQDTIFHLAGVIAYKKSARPMMDKVNIEGTRNVIQVVRDFKISKLVYLSSVVAIGGGFSSQDILNEKSIFNLSKLNLGYFETKRKAEELVQLACQAQEIEAVILNPSTIYGAGDARKGSRNTQLKVARGEFPFYTSGGVNVVAVEDVVDGIISAWQRGKSGERYILSGENILIKDLFKMIATAAGTRPPEILLPNFLLHLLGTIGDGLELLNLKGPISSENAYTSTMYHWFDNSKAKSELNFHPQPAKNAIEKSVRWMKENGLLEKKI